jgi:hypothetical protein
MLEVEAEDVLELSSIGDSFVNLIYSLALSNALGKPMGKKASNYILSEALIKAGLRGIAGSRVDKHGLADYAEGLIFQAWIKGSISLEGCVDILTKELKNRDPLRKASINAFAQLLRHIKSR